VEQEVGSEPSPEVSLELSPVVALAWSVFDSALEGVGEGQLAPEAAAGEFVLLVDQAREVMEVLEEGFELAAVPVGVHFAAASR
jgi:hypothetical protein